jgi:uncharacterized protein YaaN involved in tellurite resistance
MPRQQKTPQLKKELELNKDHFTFTKNPHAFRKSWKAKKAEANRQYRRKSDELLAVAKPENSAEDFESLVGDVTAAHLKKSVSYDRLHKRGTVSLREKIESKSQKRQETVDRRAKGKRNWDKVVHSAVTTLVALQGDELIQVVKRIAGLIQGGDPIEWMRTYQSKDRLGRTIFFVEQINRGNCNYIDALRRNQELCKAFQTWVAKANRTIAKQKRPAQRKLEQKVATQKKVKAILRQNSHS